MVTKFLDDAARAAFRHAIETIEAASAVEVVVAVRRQSAVYHHANALVGAVAGFVGLAAMLFSSHTFRLTSILIDTFVAAALGAAVVELLPSIKRALTSRAARRTAVVQAARATFVERGVHATTGRSGLLIYISWLEQEVALVGDIGLSRALPADTFTQAQGTLTAAMRDGGSAVAHALEVFASALTKALPRHRHDINELSDAIDSDVEHTR